MSKSRIGKAGIASLAVTGLVSSGLLFTAGTASAVPGFEFDRISGSDRFATSALIAEQIGDGANAILANGQVGQFADALAANYLAGDLDAPVYLTRQNNTPESILNQLEENEVENVTVVGGEGAVSEAQVDALEAEGYTVNRLSGANRFETNAEIIEAVGGAPEDTALVATGLNFADALAGGPLAEIGHPIGLASRNGVPSSVLDALEASGVDNAIIVGGEGAVGAGAVEDLEEAGINVVTRLSGAGRADTSVAVAEYGVANLGLTDTAVNLASGDAAGTGADALSGGVLTGQQGRPLLVTQSVNNPSNAVRDYIEENSDTLTEGTIFGGNGAVSAATQAELELLGQGEEVPDGNATLTVTPEERVTLAADEERDYSATDLDPALDYRITLVNSNNIEQDGAGNYSFTPRPAPQQGLAAAGQVDSDLIEVNGVVPGNSDNTQSVGGISPTADGTIDFTVETEETREDFVPVVYTDQGGDNTFLNIDESGEPTEPFGVGGEIAVVNANDFRIDPVDGRAPFGSTQTVVVQLVQLGEGETIGDEDDDSNDAPLAGEEFIVTESDDEDGPGSGQVDVSRITTDENGRATYDVTREDPGTGEGDDEIVVSLEFDPVSEDINGGDSKDSTVTFADDVREAETVDIQEPDDGDVNLVGTQETVQVQVEDNFGDGVAGETVDITVTSVEVDPTDSGPTTTTFTRTRTTNADGIATLVYNNDGDETDDAITAVVTNEDEEEGEEDTDIVDGPVNVLFRDGVATLNAGGAGEQTFETISAAVAAAEPGETITAEGDFGAEAVTVDEDVTVNAIDDATAGVFTVSAQGATVDGFDADGFIIDVAAMEDDETTDDVTVSNNTVTDAATAIAVNGGAGVDNDINVVLTGNTLADNAVGIDLNVLNVDVTDNVFTADDNTDVYVDASGAPRSAAALGAIIAANDFTPAAEVNGQLIEPVDGTR